MQKPSCRLRLRLCGFLLGSLAAITALGYSQSKTKEQNQPARNGILRIQVEYVPVNVIALDRQGQPVLDLKKEDFEVFEDDILQDIRHFSLETLVSETVIPPNSSLRAVPTLHLAPQERRTFLIMLGRGKLDRPFHNIDALIRFVQKGLLPQDQVALMAYNRATDFTTDHARIVACLTRYKEEQEKIETRLDLHFSGLAAIFAPKKISEDIQTLINSIFQVFGAADSRQLGATAIAAGSETAAQANRDSLDLLKKEMSSMGGLPLPEGARADLNETKLYTDLSLDEFASTREVTRQDLDNLFSAIRYLRYMDGEKHILFFSENGLFLPRLYDQKSLAAMADDARVVIDTFQTGGMAIQLSSGYSASMGGDEFHAAGLQGYRGAMNRDYLFSLSHLSRLSDLTGGQSSVHGDISQALDQINRTTRVQYLLGYYPKNLDWGGNFRRITLRVKNRNLRLFYRRGYYGYESPHAYDRESFLAYSRITSTATYEFDLPDISFKGTFVKGNQNSQPALQVTLSINATGIPFRQVEGLYHGKLEIAIFPADNKGKMMGDPVWNTLTMDLRESTYQRVQKEGIPYSAVVPLYDPKQSMKVVIYSYDVDKLGSGWLK